MWLKRCEFWSVIKWLWYRWAIYRTYGCELKLVLHEFLMPYVAHRDANLFDIELFRNHQTNVCTHTFHANLNSQLQVVFYFLSSSIDRVCSTSCKMSKFTSKHRLISIVDFIIALMTEITIFRNSNNTLNDDSTQRWSSSWLWRRKKIVREFCTHTYRSSMPAGS